MAFLSEEQKIKVRYYCGYGMFGLQALPASGYRFSTTYGTLEYKMINMLDGEYLEVTTFYIPNLDLLKADIPAIRQNLDTKQAAVWFWNDKEIRDRYKLFNSVRLQLCAFLDIPPGEGLPGGAVCLAV